MGDAIKHGGFIITTSGENYVSHKTIDQPTLQQIADLLGIRPLVRDKLAAESIKTIFIYTPESKK